MKREWNFRREERGLRMLILTVGLSFLLAVTIDSFSAFQSEDVLRLHILANSDREEDQLLKLAVRDRILSETGSLFLTAENAADARTAAVENREAVETAARTVLREQGSSAPVRAEVVRMFFDTRVYDGFTMPAGWYDAVRVIIGEGKGHNWWCVLYPPLYEMERAFFTLLGLQKAERVRVLSFRRLTDELFREYGGVAGDAATDTARLIAMKLALQECREELRVYAPFCRRPDFSGQMVEAISELKRAAVSLEDLETAVKKTEGFLRDKLSDLLVIRRTYEPILARHWTRRFRWRKGTAAFPLPNPQSAACGRWRIGWASAQRLRNG